MSKPEYGAGRQEFSPEFLERCKHLREQVNAQCERETQERIRTNSTPTAGELLMGAFREQLEPQIRDAIIAMNQKGYPTLSAEFIAGEPYQYVAIISDIDPDTEEKLSFLGVWVSKRPLRDRRDQNSIVVRLEFTLPDPPDLESLKATWDAIADLLPAKEGPFQPNIAKSSYDFRRRFVHSQKSKSSRFSEDSRSCTVLPRLSVRPMIALQKLNVDSTRATPLMSVEKKQLLTGG